MCGIIGQAGSNPLSVQKQTEALYRLAHRGPDADGNWRTPDERIWLGHRRLSIVDLSELGRQPMHNEDNSIWLVCNGEFYTYPGLRKTLEAKGHVFYSNSDCEAAIHAYEEWGTDFVEHLEGMFAFALWDDRQQKLVIARDRAGIKPLYYSQINDGLTFASEASGILALLPSKPALEPTALAYMMTLGYIPAPYSIWKGICKLEPGCLLVWQPESGIQIRRYWEPPRHVEAHAASDGDEWAALFERVLEEHLLSDVPVGLFLSGGLDSTSVALGLHRLKRSVEAITVTFPGSSRDEGPIAEKVASHLQLKQRCIPLQVEHIDDLLTKVARAFDEPQSYTALLTMYQISQIGAANYKVILSGDGGDEVLAGYTWYQALVPGKKAWFLDQARNWRIRLSSAERTGEVRAFQQKSLLHKHLWRLHYAFLPHEAEQLLAPLGLRFGEAEMLAPAEKHYDASLPRLRALQRVDLMTFCAESILPKVDRASMAHALEIRVPFLDHRIIEWGLTRAVTAQDGRSPKHVLRNYLRSEVPDEVLQQPKSGFSYQGIQNFDVNATVGEIERGTLVRQQIIADNWKELIRPDQRHYDQRLWILLVLSRWADNWMQ